MKRIHGAALPAAVLAILLFHGAVFHAKPAPVAPAGTPALSTSKPAQAESPSQSGLKLFGGPYVTNVTRESAVVNWVLRTGPVAVGESPAALSTITYGFDVKRATLSGLKPGVTYYYDVLKDGTAEGRGSFSTAPDSSAGFTFAVYGDTRSRNDVHRKVVEAIAKEKPAFVVHTGDLVFDGRRGEVWPAYFEISEPLLRETAFFPALGNHERNSPFFHQFFSSHLYYSFNWGKVHVAVINSDVNNYAQSREGREAFWREQLDWLDRDLKAAQPADFRFVAMHHTPFTAIKRRQPEAIELAARLLPLLRAHNVQAVFSGHDHNYQHHRSEGIEFVVTGGGGAPLYELDAPIPGVTLKTEKTENFVRVRVTGRECLMEAMGLDGRVLDSFSVVSTKAVASAVNGPHAPLARP